MGRVAAILSALEGHRVGTGRPRRAATGRRGVGGCPGRVDLCACAEDWTGQGTTLGRRVRRAPASRLRTRCASRHPAQRPQRAPPDLGLGFRVCLRRTTHGVDARPRSDGAGSGAAGLSLGLTAWGLVLEHDHADIVTTTADVGLKNEKTGDALQRRPEHEAA